MTDQQKAFAIVINCLVSLGDACNTTERYEDDLFRAAKLMDLDVMDLQNSLREGD